jgi:hypothetical protein
MEPFFCLSTGKKLPGCAWHEQFRYSQWLLPFNGFGTDEAPRRSLASGARLPPDSQDQIAQAMLSLADSDGEPEQIDPAHLADVLQGLAQAKRREFATDAEVEAALRRFER